MLLNLGESDWRHKKRHWQPVKTTRCKESQKVNMMKIVFPITLSMLTYLFMFPSISSAQNIELYCKGISTGTDVRTESHEFPMSVSFTVPMFSGIRMFMIPSCINYKNIKDPIIPDCKSNQNELSCTCSNSSGITMLNLSRVNGRLNIKTFFNTKESWEGEYMCEKITSRKF